ncbi:hypothetical protein WJX81_001526 [Elliptochloris bilobata]|uniref:dihydropyrimidinase n=1 Tax=Elliptochloris bilobata TaxID=381761 RepID=A0AAW1QVZ0_9CHLO
MHAVVLLAWCLLGAVWAIAETLLIKGGTVVNAEHQLAADVLIADGLIQAVGRDLQAPANARTINAAGKLVMPGGIDPHTHLDAHMMGTISCDDFYSGQAAALAGGTTMHIDFALPSNGDLAAGFARYQAAAAKSVMDYSFHMAVTSWDDKVAADMGELAAAGINSFKFFLAYKGVFAVTDAQLLQGLARCKELGALPMVHCENADALVDAQERVFASGVTGPEGHYLSRPAVFEDEGTARALRLAEYVNVPLYVVHVMSGGAADEVARARRGGQRVVGEAVASGFASEERMVWDADFRVAAQYVMSPPIRSPEHQRRLKAALAGGMLGVVATDHAPFNSSQKRLGLGDFRKIPNGVNGIEERLHVTWDALVATGLITPSDFVRLTSAAAAHAFNIYPRKGVLAPGSDADVIIFDPAAEHVLSAASHHSRMDTNIYEGRTVRGKVETTISQGRAVWEGGALKVRPGAGRFIALPTGGPLFDGLDRLDASYQHRNFPYGATPVKRAAPGETKSRDEL